ncbi:MAG: hypothetical protein R3C05_10490 [Pirellulaceae bacterium]
MRQLVLIDNRSVYCNAGVALVRVDLDTLAGGDVIWPKTRREN